MPSKEWLEKYEAAKEKLRCTIDLDAYFTEKEIGGTPIDTLEIGSVSFPTGEVVVCDPLVEFADARPYIQTIPAGRYPVAICVVPSEKYGKRYACVKVTVSGEKPVRYELGLCGDEEFDELQDGEFFGFCVDGGMGCVADAKTQEVFKKYWERRESEEEDIDYYNDLFCDLLEENAKTNPKYQSKYGDWLNWTVPGTDLNFPIFQSGWGDGVYPVYFGYDADGKVCGVYIHFINVEEEYKDDGDEGEAEE